MNVLAPDKTKLFLIPYTPHPTPYTPKPVIPGVNAYLSAIRA
ncbi:hypothetical protein GXM_09924 [Nostoc sphaeroides CCNUC1]|uniref:Uncharacterized protein n=1 Tax=Nostoc sphaeroides CCNUC1 TaxID=2653204 RepID=A0A5P8WIL6_9NOSO|nr:hypothetical protein GXM_09924 [Nostoc sphaeroides CCNUC1]